MSELSKEGIGIMYCLFLVIIEIERLRLIVEQNNKKKHVGVENVWLLSETM